MEKEKAEFARRLRDALQDANIEASASALEKRFNARYADGTPVTAQAISQWLNGRTIPKPDKLRVLAGMVGLEPHVLQYGGKRLAEGRAGWAEAMNAQDRAMVDAFLHLPQPKRKLVRELVAALSEAVGKG